jgi:hypothetical protein
VSKDICLFGTTKPRHRARRTVTMAAVTLVATLSLTLVPLSVGRLEAATICLNQRNQFVACSDLPAGDGAPAPSTKATTFHSAPVHDKAAHGSSVGGSIFRDAGTEAAAVVVVLSLLYLIVSLVVGFRRRQGRPRWHDRGGYRSV